LTGAYNFLQTDEVDAIDADARLRRLQVGIDPRPSARVDASYLARQLAG
jgi:hypothetical protein